MSWTEGGKPRPFPNPELEVQHLLRVTLADLSDLIAACWNEAVSVREANPERAARFVCHAQRFERRMARLRPLVYRPASDGALHAFPNARALADEYHGNGVA